MEIQTDHVYGVSGAKRSTYREPNPRELLSRIIAENKTADQPTWRRMFWETIETEREYFKSIVEWWLDNNFRALLEEPNHSQSKTTSVQRQKQTNNARAAVREHIEKEAQILPLDLVMPNGKALADCTGADCGRFGGWFSTLSKHIGAREKVGDALSEGEVRKIWIGANKK